VDRITFSILMFMIAGSFLVLILNYLSRKSNVEKIQTK